MVDITEFPSVRFIPIDGTRLVSAVHTGALSLNGWKQAKLHKWLNEIYDVTEAELAI